MSPPIANDYPYQHPASMDLVGDLSPELFEMIWRPLLEQPVQPVRFKELSISTPHNIQDRRAPANILDATCLIDDPLAPILGRWTLHGGKSEIPYKAREGFFHYNTVHIYENAVKAHARNWPWARTFRELYAAHVQSIDLQMECSVSAVTSETRECADDIQMVENTYNPVVLPIVASIIKMLRSLKYPDESAKALRMPKLSRVTIAISNRCHIPHRPQHIPKTTGWEAE